MKKMDKKSKNTMPNNLTPGQERRWESYMNRSTAFRVWKSRTQVAGTFVDEYDYVTYGYDLPKRG